MVIIHIILCLHILGIEVFDWLNIHFLFSLLWEFRLRYWLDLLVDASVQSEERSSDCDIVLHYKCTINFSKRKIRADFMEPELFFVSAGHYSQAARNQCVFKMLIIYNNNFVNISIIKHLKTVEIVI